MGLARARSFPCPPAVLPDAGGLAGFCCLPACHLWAHPNQSAAAPPAAADVVVVAGCCSSLAAASWSVNQKSAPDVGRTWKAG